MNSAVLNWKFSAFSKIVLAIFSSIILAFVLFTLSSYAISAQTRDALPQGSQQSMSPTLGVQILPQLNNLVNNFDLRPSPFPINFSCCEKDIHATEVKFSTEKTTRAQGITKVQVKFKLKLEWFCKKEEGKKCLAGYEVKVNKSKWQKRIGGPGQQWKDLAADKIKETIEEAPPLEEKCDGKKHTGFWEFTYSAELTTPQANPVRNNDLVLQLEVPQEPDKGRNFLLEVPIPFAQPNLEPSIPSEGVFLLSQEPFSCCEEKIKVDGLDVVEEKNIRNENEQTTTVHLAVRLLLDWSCKKEDKTCLAFYNINLKESKWQELNADSGKWNTLGGASVKEQVHPTLPLDEECDGKRHAGWWELKYKAVLITGSSEQFGPNPIRNTKLVFDLSIPANKGTSYTLEIEVPQTAANAKPKINELKNVKLTPKK